MIYLQQFLDDFHMWLFFQAQLAQKTTLVNDSKLKEQEFKEQVRVLFEQVKSIVSYFVSAVLKGLLFSSDDAARLHAGTMEIICL